ncbi:MAG: exopolyphosphatase [Desulfobacteraceae bacterium 4572_35.1]|nr:MAG: exopolyphosphatase [Desulfobacteraceae bacterium 4572_35.1]
MRLLTRSDFDGIACAALLKELGVIDSMEYAHPKDLQDGKIEVTENDILANVPYVPGCGLWFDHHSSEKERLDLEGQYQGSSCEAPSAARVVYDYYNDPRLDKFDEMLMYVDRVDSAQLTEEEILNPSGWVLLGFLCDPRTGLGYHKSFTISNLQLMKNLMEALRSQSIDEIMADPNIKERVQMYFENDARSKEFLQKNTRIDGCVAITDARGLTDMPPGNRFLIYMFPQTNVSVRMIDGRGKKFVAISVGYSILNRTATVDVGSLMLKYGGGGHKAVGTCQVPYADADRVLAEMIEVIKG